MIIYAPAKINLSLEILGKKPDGYHEIRSIMQTVDIYDMIELKRATRINITGSMTTPATENIVFKAIKEVEVYAGRPLPCSIHLVKSIPVGAGMGGGSSDAAAIIKGLNMLFDLNMENDVMRKIGTKVGSDVPFFLVGGKCMVEGAGDIVTPMPRDEGRFLYILFRPHKRLSTKEAFEEFDRTGKSFSEMALEKCPQLQGVLDFFRDAVVSGKGPTVWVKREYYYAYVGEQRIKAIAGGLDSFLRSWEGDIFYTRVAEGCLSGVKIY